MDWLRPDARSGDHGITLEEYTPFGVVGAVTPSTHSIPTMSGNIVNIIAAGNAVVFNAHPSAVRCAAAAVRIYNETIYRETGIENIACVIEKPTMESFAAICKHEAIRLLLVTGGPAVVKAAMQTGKRAICAGPGNPPDIRGRHRVHETRGEGQQQGALCPTIPAVHRREEVSRSTPSPAN